MGAVAAIVVVCFAETRPSTSPATSPAALGVGPLTYFEEHCARCHGSYGSGYLPDSLGRRNEQSLRTIIREMSAGPAQAPLDEPDLDAQVAYHRSILTQTPFVAITKRTADEISGEASPGATLTLTLPDTSIEIPLDGHTWTLSTKELDNSALDQASLVGATGDKETTLPIAESFSRNNVNNDPSR